MRDPYHRRGAPACYCAPASFDLPRRIAPLWQTGGARILSTYRRGAARRHVAGECRDGGEDERDGGVDRRIGA